MRMLKKKIKFILLDFDMTLIDSKPVALSTLELMKSEGLNIEGITIDRIFGQSIDENIDDILVRNSFMDRSCLKKMYLERLSEEYMHREILCEDSLLMLQKNGFVLGIVSNSSSIAIKKFLSKIENKNLKFVTVLGPEDKLSSSDSKSNLIFKALNDLNFESNETVYVGDHPNDMIQAKKTGILGIGITTGLHNKKELVDNGADFVIESLNDLENMFF